MLGGLGTKVCYVRWLRKQRWTAMLGGLGTKVVCYVRWFENKGGLLC